MMWSQHRPPTTALRLLNNASGLFDKGATGRESVASELDFLSDILDSPTTSDKLDGQFNEVFTDLTDFLLQGESSNADEDQVKRGRKRTATEALLTAMESPASPVTDHSDYTLKPKYPRESSDQTTVEKYTERRIKNNIASKRSRDTRKQKLLSMEEEAERLEKQNVLLEQKVKDLECLAASMKASLVQRLAKS